MTARKPSEASKIEWSWDDSPILMPLAFESREWNAVYIAFFLAEYSGSQIYMIHVKSVNEDQDKVKTFLNRIEAFASALKVKYTVTEIDTGRKEPSVSDIAKEIVSASERLDCQAIIMAAHRESFFRELFGRISDRVVRDSKRTVLLVESPHPGVTIPLAPSKILIPIMRDKHDASPYIVAAALTSTASAPNTELVVARVVTLPLTTPLDAVDFSKSLGELEQRFSNEVADSIKSLGRLFIPKILPVREVGEDLKGYAQEIGADAMILWSDKPSGFHKLLTRDEYEVVKRTPCVVIVAFPKRKLTKEPT
ncbi:MAG: universal stress protein [Thaumarchaeota archaeon]|nr:universal stress protein [Nitrososphaerota archaeon]